MTTPYEAAGGDRTVAILQHRIETALAALGPIGKEAETGHLDEFCPRRAQIAQFRAEIARIEALRNPAASQPATGASS